MRVVEHITYDFDGDFHNGTRPIPPGNYDIVDMTVTEHGEPLPFDGAPYQLAWHFSAAGWLASQRQVSRSQQSALRQGRSL